MVCRGGDGRHLINTSGQALGDIGGELAVGGDTIETLEEREDTRVGGCGRVERWDRLNDDVIVSDDLPGVVQLLRSGVVGVGSVGKGTSLHSVNVLMGA